MIYHAKLLNIKRIVDHGSRLKVITNKPLKDHLTVDNGGFVVDGLEVNSGKKVQIEFAIKSENYRKGLLYKYKRRKRCGGWKGFKTYCYSLEVNKVIQ